MPHNCGHERKCWLFEKAIIRARLLVAVLAGAVYVREPCAIPGYTRSNLGNAIVKDHRRRQPWTLERGRPLSHGFGTAERALRPARQETALNFAQSLQLDR